jgi:outer membrane protein assembly factor BamE (lipoprotein component of BamABCDE complex)
LSKRGLIILVLGVLFGVYFFVVGYEFLEKENALWQKKVKAAKEEQRRCEARNARYRSFDQFRTSIRLPYASDLPPERWMQKFDTVRAGMSEPEVEIILGAPDFVRCVLSEKGDKFAGSYWQYEVAAARDVANDAENSSIAVEFGPDGRVEDKHARNMQPKPSPTPSATAAASATPVSAPASSATPTPAVLPSATPDVSVTPVAAPNATPTASATPAATASPSPQ